MSVTLQQVEISSDNVPLRKFIDKIKDGEICLPIFQRDFVWTDKQVRDLFESIIYNHPIGVIILWKPHKEILDKIHYLPFDDRIECNKQELYLVLDGNQRLTSLFLAVNNWRLRRFQKTISIAPICIFRRGEKVELEICDEQTRSTEKCELCLDDIIKAFGLYDRHKIQELAQKYAQDHIEKVRNLAMQILEYRVPVYYYITKTSTEDVAIAISESFIRINKTGTRIGNVELLISLVISILTSKDIDAGKLIWKKYNEARQKYGIDPTIYYRLLIKLIGFKQTDVARVPLRKLRSLEEEIRKASISELRNNLDLLDRAISVTYNYFDSILGLKSLDDVPSTITLVPVIYYIYNKIRNSLNISPSEFKRLLEWYILASLRGLYSGSGVDSKLEKTLKEAEKSIEGMYDVLVSSLKREELSELKIDKDDLVRSFRGRGRGVMSDSAIFLLKTLLTLNGADDWSGRKISFSCLDLDLHHIFPRISSEKTDSLANLTFINSAINKSVRNKHPLKYIFEELKLSEETLRKHFMPLEPTIYNDFEKFIKIRAELMHKAGKELLPSIFR